MAKIKVLIVEDHAVVREGLKILVRADPAIEVAGEAGDGRQALRVAQKVRPDVVLMDLTMPRMNGLEATKKILQRQPDSKVLVLSSSTDDDSVRALMRAGAAGYLTKHSASDDLLKAIRQVNGGKFYMSPSLARRLRSQTQGDLWDGIWKARELTARERQVLTLIAEGMPTKRIAQRLDVSAKTIEKHRQQVMDKLNLHDIAGLTRYAADKGLIGVGGTRP